MHILFLTDNFPPEVNAPANRTYEHAREWVRLGHEVTIITCVPNFPTGQIFKGYKNKIWQSEYIDGIRVIRVWSFVAANEGFLQRTLDHLSFMFSSIGAGILVRRIDVIIGTSPQFFTVCSAWVLSLLKAKPFVFELRDIWPESILVVGALNNKIIFKVLEKIELFLYRRANKIIVVTNSFKKILSERGVSPQKIYVLTNGVDLERYKPQKRNLALLDRINLKDDDFVVGYIGTIGLAHALDTVVDAARILSKKSETGNIKFILVGNGAAKKKLMDRAYGLDHVIFIDTVSKEEVINYWSLLDVAIIHLKKSNLFRSVIPSKMFECMAMGIPIVHGVDGESAAIVKRHNAGIVFEPENVQELCSVLTKLNGNIPMLEELSSGSRIGSEEFDRANLARRMLAILMK